MPPRHITSSRNSPPQVSDEDSSPGCSSTRPYRGTPARSQGDPLAPSAVLMSIASHPPSHSHSPSPSPSNTRSYQPPSTSISAPSSSSSSSPYASSHISPPSHSQHYPSDAFSPYHHLSLNQSHSHDRSYSLTLTSTSTSPPPSLLLRHHNLPTKSAWTTIPSSEGLRILELCKTLSSTSSTSTTTNSSVPLSDETRIPCYNRRILFDEEWQAHMKDVHGVFLLWPETWMKRVEVLDLDAFNGDIGSVNGVLM